MNTNDTSNNKSTKATKAKITTKSSLSLDSEKAKSKAVKRKTVSKKTKPNKENELNTDLSQHPQNLKRVCIFGGGPMGQAAALLLRSNGSEVRLWVRELNEKNREQLNLLKSVGIEVTDDFEHAIENSLVFFFAVPADALLEVVNRFAPYSRGFHVALHGIRGLTRNFELPHEVLRDHTNIKKIGVLGGPLYFEELKANQILVAILASRFDEVIEEITEVSKNSQVLIHESHDVIGVEIAGAVSNITAIAVGISEALELGQTTKGLLLTHGLSEATRLGLVLGASAETFSGLAGVGDLIPRKVASIARHIELGKRLVSGESIEAILATTTGCVEGVISAQAVSKNADELNIQLPLIECVNKLINWNSDTKNQSNQSKDKKKTKDIKKVAEELIFNLLRMDLLIGSEAKTKLTKNNRARRS
jgi:glycerol-3-phosphate dehydrogenase (NAD(P)+)